MSSAPLGAERLASSRAHLMDFVEDGAAITAGVTGASSFLSLGFPADRSLCRYTWVQDALWGRAVDT
jgi:hypothetical protein